MKLKTLRDFNIKNKLILLRIGIDSPVVSGKVLDNPRFKEASQTITQLLEKDAKIVIIAHQGRKGDSDRWDRGAGTGRTGRRLQLYFFLSDVTGNGTADFFSGSQQRLRRGH